MKSPFNRTNRVKVGLVLLAAITGVGFLVVPRTPREPEYEGVPLSDYLRSLTYSQVRLERSARDAIKAIGSNAVPYLIEILEARESPFKTWFNRTADRQSFIPIRFRFIPLSARQFQAALACQELGPTAAPAIPALARLIDDPQLGFWSVAALAEIGPQTFPILTNALFSTNVSVRTAAAGYLRRMRPPERAVPPLLVALGNPDSRTRSAAAESLGALGLASPEILSALDSCLNDPVISVRISAAQGLGWCGTAAVASIAKLRELHRAQEGLPEQRRIAEALASMDPAAAQGMGLTK